MTHAIGEALKPFVAAGLAALGVLWTWAGFVAVAPVGHGPAPAGAPFVGADRAAGPGGGALSLDGEAALILDGFRLPDDAFTIECWVRAGAADRTESLFGNTAKGGVELVWNDADRRCPVPRPTVWLRTARTLTSPNSGWTSAAVAEPAPAERWTHVAVVVDARRVRTFIAGRLASDTALLGPCVPSEVAFVIGGDADEFGEPVDCFVGRIDEFRISHGARYDGDFDPRGLLGADPDTLLHLSFDDPDRPFRDDGPLDRAVTTWGNLEVVSAR